MESVTSDRQSGHSGKLLSLEVARGIAATAVVLDHAGISANAFTSGAAVPSFEWGALGVDFFFVLSGFIIYFVHHADPKGLVAARRFLVKRIRRIYVPYLPIGIVMGLVYTLVPELSQGNRAWGWPATLTLLPFASPPALSVAWTLVFEMIFYLVFVGFYFIPRFGIAMWIWAFSVATANMSGMMGAHPPEPLAHLLSYHILEFLAGMATAHLTVKGPVPDWRLALAASAVLIGTYLLFDGVNRVCFGLGLAPLVLLLARWERRKAPGFPRALILVGAASYAIYLIHNPVVSVAARVTPFSHSGFLTLIVLVLSGIGAGLAYHLGYERPTLALVSRRQVGARLSRHG